MELFSVVLLSALAVLGFFYLARAAAAALFARELAGMVLLVPLGGELNGAVEYLRAVDRLLPRCARVVVAERHDESLETLLDTGLCDAVMSPGQLGELKTYIGGGEAARRRPDA